MTTYEIVVGANATKLCKLQCENYSFGDKKFAKLPLKRHFSTFYVASANNVLFTCSVFVQLASQQSTTANSEAEGRHQNLKRFFFVTEHQIDFFVPEFPSSEEIDVSKYGNYVGRYLFTSKTKMSTLTCSGPSECGTMSIL